MENVIIKLFDVLMTKAKSIKLNAFIDYLILATIYDLKIAYYHVLENLSKNTDLQTLVMTSVMLKINTKELSKNFGFVS